MESISSTFGSTAITGHHTSSAAEPLPHPELSVVVATCSRAALLERALGSLIAQQVRPEWPFEIVVVDDGSTDSTPDLLQRLAATSPVPLHIVRTDGIGVPAARNLGFTTARAPWIASFDDDQLASPTWLDTLRAAADTTQARCFGGALVLALPAACDPSSLGPRARALLGEHVPSHHLSPYPEGHLPATNNALIARDVFDSVSGFDTSFTQGGSDTDFFRRVEAAGHPIWFVPAATAQHLIPPSRVTDNYLRWTSFKVAASRVRMLRKGRRRAIARLAVSRLGVALLRDLPTLVRARATGNSAAHLDARCSLWFTQGVLRSLLALATPGWRRNNGFWDSLDFRRHHDERPTNPLI